MRLRSAILITGLLWVAWLPAAHAQLPATVASLLKAANIPDEAMGAVVLRLPDGAPLISHNAQRSLQPGSTMKLVTTLAALDTLGPVYRGRSELRTNGKLVDGVLQGDLVLRGLADTDLRWEALQGMLQTMRNHGIETIRGDLLLDRQLFNPARADLGAAPFDEAPEFEYNVIPDALLLNGNLLRFELESDDRQIRVSMMPVLDRVSVDTDMTLTESDCKDWDKDWLPPDHARADDGSIGIMLHGKYPKNCTRPALINILDRVDYADRLFRLLWSRMGGKFLGTTRDAAMPADTRLLAEHQSRPLPVVVREINKQSDNALARLLYLVLGTAGAEGDNGMATSVRSERKVRAWLLRQGIDDQGLVLENGSGLSRLERIKPAQLAAILLAASRGNLAPEFLSSLPLAAVDGTMRRRLPDSPAAGRARIKTGSLKGVAAVAGFVPDAANRSCVVVAMINHESASNAVSRQVLDALIDWVARSGLE